MEERKSGCWLKFGIIAGILLLTLSIFLWLFSKRSEDNFQTYLKELEAKGYKTSLKNLFPECSDEDNAYIPLKEAVNEFEKTNNPLNYSYVDLIGSPEKVDSLTKEKYEKLQDFLSKNKKTIDYIKIASEKSSYNPHPDYSKPIWLWDDSITYMTLNYLQKLILSKSYMALNEKDFEKAVEYCILSCKFIKTSTKNPFTINIVINALMCLKNIKLIKAISSSYEIPEKDVKTINNLIDPQYFHKAFIKSFDNERIINMIIYSNYSQSTSDMLNKPNPPVGMTPIFFKGEKIFYPLLESGLKNNIPFAQNIFIQNNKALEKPYSEYKEVQKNIEKEIEEVGFFNKLVFVLGTYSENFFSFYFEHSNRLYKVEAKEQTTRLALACKLYKRTHGKFPASLGNLIPEYFDKMPMDPFTGKPCIYKAFPDGSFVVYSVGENLKDDCKAFTTIEEFESVIDKFTQNMDKREESNYDIIWIEKAK